jgi:hypothetical protein
MKSERHFRRVTEPYPRRFSVSEWEVLGKVNELITLPVSARGDGLCLYLPKDLCRVYGLIAGDRLKVHLQLHFRKRRSEENESTRTDQGEL